jgi:hypothetical protein
MSERSIALLGKLSAAEPDGSDRGFEGLRTVQHYRTKLKGHVGGSDAERLTREALQRHGTFRDHFRDVCRQVVEDLEVIEALFGTLGNG